MRRTLSSKSPIWGIGDLYTGRQNHINSLGPIDMQPHLALTVRRPAFLLMAVLTAALSSGNALASSNTVANADCEAVKRAQPVFAMRALDTPITEILSRGSFAEQFPLVQIHMVCDKGTDDGVPTAMQWLMDASVRGDTLAQDFLGSMYMAGYARTKPDLQEAVKWLTLASEGGLAAAQAKLGWMYLNGKGMPVDFSKGAYWSKRAADQGDLIAQINLGLCYLNGWGLTVDPKEAFRLLLQAAERKHPHAQYIVGAMYYNGIGVPRDEAQALHWLRTARAQGSANVGELIAQIEGLDDGLPKDRSLAIRALAEMGDAEAQNALGELYNEVGSQLRTRQSDAFKWYKLSASQGYAPAQFNLAMYYFLGAGTTRNKEEGYRLLRLASAQGFAKAQQHLGEYLFYEYLPGRDLTEAQYWLTKATQQGMADRGGLLERIANLNANKSLAEQGNADAQYALGVTYGKDANMLADAFKWFQRAGAQGHAAALLRLGQMAENGEATKQDFTVALRMYRKAADAGNAEATRKVADMYANGRAVDQDDALAAKWYAAAADLGDAQSKVTLGRMLEDGQGVVQDYRAAGKLYLSVATGQKNYYREVAQYRFGNLLYEGHGFQKDDLKAYVWFDLASDSVNNDARLQLSKLRELLDEHSLSLAKQLANQCRDSNFQKCE